MHYGDRSVIDGGQFRTSLRSFQYIVEEGYAGDTKPKTDPLTVDKACYE